jgi:hypothetical protein
MNADIIQIGGSEDISDWAEIAGMAETKIHRR